MKKLLTLLLSIVTIFNAHAASVNWGADANFNMVLEDSTSALLRVGSLAQIGFFDLTDTQIRNLAAPTPGNIATLNAAFTSFASVRVGFGFSGDPGGFTTGSSGSQTLAGSQIYYWVLKSTNDDSDVPESISTAFEQAILYRDKTVDTDWMFPTDLEAAKTIDIGDLQGTGPTFAIATGGVVLAGSYVANSVNGTNYNGAASSAIQLVALPEPTTAFLSAMGVTALAWVRRRKRN